MAGEASGWQLMDVTIPENHQLRRRPSFRLVADGKNLSPMPSALEVK